MLSLHFYKLWFCFWQTMSWFSFSRTCTQKKSTIPNSKKLSKSIKHIDQTNWAKSRFNVLAGVDLRIFQRSTGHNSYFNPLESALDAVLKIYANREHARKRKRNVDRAMGLLFDGYNHMKMSKIVRLRIFWSVITSFCVKGPPYGQISGFFLTNLHGKTNKMGRLEYTAALWHRDFCFVRWVIWLFVFYWWNIVWAK